VDQHIHTHIVPRWSGDTNFMPLLAGTKVINEAIEETYKMLKPHFETLEEV
jgi:ATP adenylyltransferase